MTSAQMAHESMDFKANLKITRNVGKIQREKEEMQAELEHLRKESKDFDLRLEQSLKEQLDRNLAGLNAERSVLRSQFEDTQKYVSEQLKLKEQELGTLNENIDQIKRGMKLKYQAKY